MIVAADKESCIAILNKSGYIRKVNNIFKEGIQQGKYIERIDTTHSNLKQDFLYMYYKKSNFYDQMFPVSNQPGRFFAIAKTNKWPSLNEITVENLKLRAIIDITRRMTYNVSKVIGNHLRPLSRNQYTISGSLNFLDLLESADINANVEDVCNDLKSLFTSVLVAETTEYILKCIYTNKESKPLCK